jgi:hypothetical protein
MFDIADYHGTVRLLSGLLLLFLEPFGLKVNEPLQGISIASRNSGDFPFEVLVTPVSSLLFSIVLDLKLVDGIHDNTNRRGTILKDKGS